MMRVTAGLGQTTFDLSLMRVLSRCYSAGVTEVTGSAEDRPGASAYRRLPNPVRLEDTVAVTDASPVPDPTRGRDTETEFLLRHAG
jgi:hypothetical protein